MNIINNKVSTRIAAALAAGVFSATANAGVPLNDFQGSGGLGYNPVAYLAGVYSDGDGTNTLSGIVSRPQVGAWTINFHETGVSWTSLSAAFSVAKRLELSYAYGLVNGVDGFTGTRGVIKDTYINTHTIGAKANIIEENAFDTAWVPAISVGARWKYTDSKLAEKGLGLDDSGLDFYAVATKLITQTPIPVLLSAGIEYSDSFVYGIAGHNDYGAAPFGSITLIPLKQLAVGFEYRGGADVGDGFENHDYYNIHAAWFVNDNLTLVAAYGWTGHEYAKDGRLNDFGLGDAAVLSLQYQF